MEIRVTRARKIWGEGRHNAFTGIGAAFGKTYVAFRSAAGHMAGDGAIRLVASGDRETWGTAALWTIADSDLRDPKVAFFGGRLRVYFAQRRPNAPRQMWMAESADGTAFGEPVRLKGVPEGHWLWHVREFGGRMYGTAYRRQSGAHLAALFGSDDGLEWRRLAELPVPGNETWLDFDGEGTLWALVRDDLFGSVPALCAARPPYERFDSAVRLPMRLQGPMLKRLAGGCAIVGRQWDEPGWRNLRTDLFWLADGGAPQRICTLPSGGDTSYADWLDVGPGRAVVSYYSSHEYAMDDAVGGRVGEPDEGEGEGEALPPGADVFLADVCFAE